MSYVRYAYVVGFRSLRLVGERKPSCEATERREATPGGGRGGKGLTQGEAAAVRTLSRCAASIRIMAACRTTSDAKSLITTSDPREEPR